MYIKVGIDPHDLGVKMNKIKVFLSAGHQAHTHTYTHTHTHTHTHTALRSPNTVAGVLCR